MDVSSLVGVAPADYLDLVAEQTMLSGATGEKSFDSVLASAMEMLTETNALQNDAQAAKLEFAIGNADNPHDMLIAAAKASSALQYTVAIRDKLLDAYKEIMNMQI